MGVTDTPVFVFLVTSVLGFKARVDPLRAFLACMILGCHNSYYIAVTVNGSGPLPSASVIIHKNMVGRLLKSYILPETKPGYQYPH